MPLTTLNIKTVLNKSGAKEVLGLPVLWDNGSGGCPCLEYCGVNMKKAGSKSNRKKKTTKTKQKKRDT